MERLYRKQLELFGLAGKTVSFNSPAAAEKFLSTVGIALRYWRTESLPLASLYQAAWGRPEPPPKPAKGVKGGPKDEAQRVAIELTNHLLATHTGIEVSVIANRITLVHRNLVPGLYALVRRHRPVADQAGISQQSRKVFQWIKDSKETTAGGVRKFLGKKSAGKDDPAYHALAELQRHMLIDRGPFVMNKGPIPYLSKEGYPYHCFHSCHPELVKQASGLSLEQAARDFLMGYLAGAGYGSVRKMNAMFAAFISPIEMAQALNSIVNDKRSGVKQLEKTDILVHRK